VSKPKKKKLFLTDGWEVGLTGICIYIIRLNTAKQLPEEGFHKDLICGTLDAEKKGLVKSIAKIIEYVFIPALAIPQTGDEPSDDQPDCPLIKSQLLPELRSFCSCLKGIIYNTITIIHLKFSSKNNSTDSRLSSTSRDKLNGYLPSVMVLAISQ